jgi:hypothetical protein
MAMKYLIYFCILAISLIYPFKLSYGQIDKKMKLLDFSNREWQEIRIKEDWANQKAYLISSNKNATDSLEVNDVAEIDTAIVLFDSFIRIGYRCNGGSGVHLRLSKVFCINNGHICEPLSLLTQQESYSSDGELQEKYWVDILFKFAKNKYSAILTENEQDKNGNVLKKDYNVLLDQEDMIFFSQRERSSNISFCSLQPQRKVAYYLISLKKETYINYEGIWYKKGAKCYKRM